MASDPSSVNQWITDLENHGIDGSNRLRHFLMTCSDPIATIKEFQEKNSLKLQTLKPAMKLLDLHNIRRTEFHELAVNDLTELLLNKIRTLGAEGTKESHRKLEQQLGRSFKLYRAPKFRPIVLETLKQLPKVPDRYLKIIVADKEFYNCCAVSVRQQIWLKNDALYVEAVKPVIESYIEKKQRIMLTVDQSPTNFFTCETTKARRQWPEVQELITMVGELEVLYDRLMGLIRQRFIETDDVNYCTLRMEIVMAAHDSNVDSIVKLDACHDFAWCLDACVRDKHLDVQQTNKLKNFLDSIKKSSVETTGDMAMIAADAHVVHFLCSMCVKVLRDNAANTNAGHLPRELPSLQLLFRLLNLGANAHYLLTADESSAVISVDALIFTKFLTSMSSLVVEDILRNELSRAPDEVVDENPVEDFLSEPTDTQLSFLKTDVSCALLWIHYTAEMFPAKRRVGDIMGLVRYLKILPKLKEKMAYREPWAHLLTHRLLQSAPFENCLTNEEFVSCFIDDYLSGGLDNFGGIKYHLLRIAHLQGSTLSEFRMRSILERLAPEKIFEPGAVDEETDVERYTAEFSRVHAKIADKSAAVETAAMVSPVSPVAPLQSIESSPPS